MADHAVFTIDDHEITIDRADDGTVAARVGYSDGSDWPATFTSDEWRAFAAKVQAAIDAAGPVIGGR